ncbi:MAG: crossover junction endodeoxyribonuclease RuvC [Patescibacteria group bacterium]
MIIIGIDPGLASLGYGIIKKDKKVLKHITHGVIKTTPDMDIEERFLSIYNQIKKIIKEYEPNEASMERLFFFRNQRTVIQVSQVQGIIMLAFKQKKIPLNIYTPLNIKNVITGDGKAKKVDIQKTVQKILKMERHPTPDDAADGLAVAICHSFKIQ